MTHYPPVVAALVTMLLTLILLVSKTGKLVQDIPNERSLHVVPTPRIGGLGIMGGVISAWALMLNFLNWWIVFPMLALIGLSLIDDIRGVPVRIRLVAQLGAAGVALIGSGLVMQYPLLAVVLWFSVVWMTNLYNFMDGSDGLAGGMAFFGFSAYGVASLMFGNEVLAMLNFSIAAAALGFLYFNFYPAKVFMGDAGSIPLGFLSAVMGIIGWQRSLWPLWFPLFVFSPFILDATVTLIRRSLQKKNIADAHREHYYQRLVMMGWSHKKVAIVGYVLMLISGASSVWAIQDSSRWPWSVIVFLGGFYACSMFLIDRRWGALHREK